MDKQFFHRIHLSPKAVGVSAAILFETIYGASFVFTKAVTGTYSTLTIQFWRFGLALLCFILLNVLGLISVRIRISAFLHALPAVLCYPVFYLFLETAGIRLTTASESGIIISSCPIVCIIASTLVLHRKPTFFQIIGILIALVGTAAAVLSKGADAAFSPKGYSALFLALIVYSFYSVSVERLSDSCSGTEFTCMMLTVGFLCFGCGAVLEHLRTDTLRSLLITPIQDPVFRYSVLYLALLSSLLAFFLNNLAISRIGTNRTATFAGIDTAVSILLGACVQHDRITVWQILGVLLILAGVYLANNTPAVHSKSDSALLSR